MLTASKIKSTFLPVSCGDEYKDKIPNLTYHLFEKIVHYPMLKEQEPFDKKLIEWIKSH